MENREEQALIDAFLTPISSPEHMRDWIFNYLGIDLPLGTVDPESNSSPSEWLYEAYNNIRMNLGAKVPGYIVYAPREGYKTLTTAMLEILCAVHFMLPVAHMAAIESQSRKAIQYISNFTRKLAPYLAANEMEIKKSNTRNTEFQDKDGNLAYITVIICTLQGANSEHVTLFVIDEVDVVRFPQAYEESKMIPGVMRGKYPLNVKTSTRKFAFGLMQKEIDNAAHSGDTVLHWNIIDVTERCTKERHKPEEKKQTRFIRPRDLPLKNLSKEEYLFLSEEERSKYTEIKAYAGCAKCSLLPVCQMRLAHRPENDYGGLWKPIDFTANQFKKISPDMAEAQLMCWKPSSKGLIYPKYDSKNNELSVADAFKTLSGEDIPNKDFNFYHLVKYMLSLDIKFYGHLDWGFRHNFALVVTARIPNGDWWIMHTLAIPGLELEEIIKISLEQRNFFRIRQWHADTAYPAYIKTFKKNGMPCSKFKKDIDAGIEAVRGQVQDAYAKCKLKIIKTEHNDFIISGFKNHHFKLDAAGIPTREPDDEEYADVMDALRYGAQNLFKPSTGIIAPKSIPTDMEAYMEKNDTQKYQDWVTQKTEQLHRINEVGTKGRSKSGSVFFDFSNPMFTDNEDED